MDPLADLLDGPRARGAFLLRAQLDPPWSVRVRDGAPLTLISLVRGEAWTIPNEGEPVRLGPGDTALLRGPAPYTVSGDPATSPRVVIHPGQRSTTPDGADLCAPMNLGVRTWGDNPNAGTLMLVGTYPLPGEVGARLLRALPPLAMLPGDAWENPLIPLLVRETARDEPGQPVVLDRLLDLLLTGVLRAWFARSRARPPQWYQARADPVVGTALRLLEEAPAHPWTVGELASAAGASRAALARRFAALVGEPPMAYLTGRRLALAAELLTEPDATLAAVARRVGYGGAFTLSAAFKREHGVSPSEYRAARRERSRDLSEQRQ